MRDIWGRRWRREIREIDEEGMKWMEGRMREGKEDNCVAHSIVAVFLPQSVFL
jgi:hypothetical protein